MSSDLDFMSPYFVSLMNNSEINTFELNLTKSFVVDTGKTDWNILIKKH